MTTESQTAAATNGCKMEAIVRALYPGSHFEYTGLIDFSIDGVRVEVKSCQDKISDSSVSRGIRSGRFCFSDLQHQTLLKNRGEYILLVHREGIPIIYVRIPASKLHLKKFTGVKSVCWKSVITEAVA